MNALTDAQAHRLVTLAASLDVHPDELLRRVVELGLTALDWPSPPSHTWPPRHGENLERALMANRKRREKREQAA